MKNGKTVTIKLDTNRRLLHRSMSSWREAEREMVWVLGYFFLVVKQMRCSRRTIAVYKVFPSPQISLATSSSEIPFGKLTGIPNTRWDVESNMWWIGAMYNFNMALKPDWMSPVSRPSFPNGFRICPAGPSLDVPLISITVMSGIGETPKPSHKLRLQISSVERAYGSIPLTGKHSPYPSSSSWRSIRFVNRSACAPAD